MAESRAVMPDGFPAGLRVFAADDDAGVLRTLELMLLKCGYKVTVSNHAFQALELLRANKYEYDIVIIDINMMEMDGFKLMEIIGVEMNLPVILLSANSDYKNVIQSIKYGAVDYLVKPVRFEELRLIWKHVAKRSIIDKKCANINESKFKDAHSSQFTKYCEEHVKERDENDNIQSEDDSTTQKKARVTWTPQLHAKFINAVNKLGIDRAVPKKILDIMEIPGLTRENVASHLQKYRKSLKRSTIEFSQQVFANSRIRGYGESSLPLAVNRSRANLYKHKSISSSYISGQQSHNDQGFSSQTRFSPSIRQYNNLHPQNMMNSSGSHLGIQQLEMTTKSQLMNISTQLSDYQSFSSCLKWFNCQAESSPHTWISDGYTKPNSDAQLESIMDQQDDDMFLNNNFDINNSSNELGALFAFEQEQRHNSIGSNADVEMERQINLTLLDVQSHNFQDYSASNTSDLSLFSEEILPIETTGIAFEFDKLNYIDDLRVAFGQENLDYLVAQSL